MSELSIAHLALPGVTILIAFLAYGSQILFQYIEPCPLATGEARTFNILVCCIWVCYFRACFVNPGLVPARPKPEVLQEDYAAQSAATLDLVQKRCRKCNAFKPPRAHHCKACGRCIPKMDHHCPWTVNCVSHRTFPHFFRFLFYAVASMCTLEYHLYIRAWFLWERRHLPSYLGPSPAQLVFLFVFVVTNSVMLFALSILLIRNLWVLGVNVTTIEGWEIERHATLVCRAKVRGGFLDGPDGVRVRIMKHEFPYDIGIFSNIQQALGKNPLIWLWPFAATLSNESGLYFETNGFEEPGSAWPPPDPDRMPRRNRGLDSQHAFTYDDDVHSAQDHMRAFKQRQEHDLARLGERHRPVARRTPFREPFEDPFPDSIEIDQAMPSDGGKVEGEASWENSEGERLKDFGVDEDAEFYDQDDDIPLSQLMLRRRYEAKTYNNNLNSTQ